MTETVRADGDGNMCDGAELAALRSALEQAEEDVESAERHVVALENHRDGLILRSEIAEAHAERLAGELIQERRAARRFEHDLLGCQSQIRAFTDHVDDLERRAEMLMRWAEKQDHGDDCATTRSYDLATDRWTIHGVCSCGLTAALGLAPKEGEQG